MKLRELVELGSTVAVKHFKATGRTGHPTMIVETEDGETSIVVIPELGGPAKPLILAMLRDFLAERKAVQYCLIFEAWIVSIDRKPGDPIPDVAGSYADQTGYASLEDHPDRKEAISYIAGNIYGEVTGALQVIERPAKGKAKLRPLDFNDGHHGTFANLLTPIRRTKQ